MQRVHTCHLLGKLQSSQCRGHEGWLIDTSINIWKISPRLSVRHKAEDADWWKDCGGF